MKIPLELKKGVELNGRYVIGELAGSGGFATVWRATDKIEGRDVAIKRFSENFRVANPEAFLAEAESIKKLTGHKNIVQLYETFTQNDESFLVMEYVNGGTLQDTLKKHVMNGTWIDQEEAIDYIKQILEGLIYAHSSGLYHRDVKPSNILVTSVGVIKLADFGLAKAMIEEIKGHGKGYIGWTGTPHYMSYEQARGDALNHQTDIMSVGIIAYMLITGRHPFNHPSGVLSVNELIKDQYYSGPKPAAWDGKPLKPVLADILLRMLHKEKSSRYQSLIEPFSLLSKDDSVQCRHCLSSNPKSNKFCGQCGESLKENEPTQVALKNHPQPDEFTPEQLTAWGFEETRQNNWEDAIRLYREALLKDKTYAAAHANLGFALNRKGEYKQAIEKATEGLKSAKDNGIRHRLYDVIGFAEYSLNRPQDAIRNYSAAIDLRDNPRVFVHRAEAKAAIGDIPGAYEDVLSALEIDSDYYPATKLQARLDKLL
jgi:serine/threonine protein kinase